MENNREQSRWWFFLQTRMGRRLLAVLLSVSLLPLLIVGWLALGSSKKALEEQTRFALRASVRAAEGQLREFLFRMKQATTAFASDPGVTDLLGQVMEADNHPAFEESLISLCEWRLRVVPDVQEFFIMSPNGVIIGSSSRNQIGKKSDDTDYFREGQSRFFYGAIVAEKDGTGRWIMSAPVTDPESKRLLGVVGCRITPETLNELTSGRRVMNLGARGQTLRVGDTGETYLVDGRKRIITETRAVTNGSLNLVADTLPVRWALSEGKEVTAEYRDYRGVLVWGASVIVPEMGWTLVTEIDFSQAFAQVRRSRAGLILMGISLAVLVTLLACNWTEKIMRPLAMLRRADRALARGDEAGAIVPEDTLPANELGDFVRTRNRRVQELFSKQRELGAEQKRRRKAAAELDRISYAIVHDMRAPLRAVTSFGQILREDLDGQLQGEHRDYLNRMIVAASRMDQLITDMLSYSRLVREEIPLSAVDPAQMVREMIATYPTLGGLKENIEIAEGVPMVRGNNAALSQCFARILENAIQFSKPGQPAHVRIEWEQRDGRTRLWIRDNGVGIPMHMHTKIFGIFQQGTAAPQATGIGLALVKAAVEAMRGTVGVESEPGAGSSFWIELETVVAATDKTASAAKDHFSLPGSVSS